MKTKFRVLLALICITLLLVTLLLNFGNRSPLLVLAESHNRNLPTPTPYPTAWPGVTSQILGKYAHSEVVTKTVYGVEMSAANYRIENAELKVDICFQSPDAGEWIYGDVTIQIGNVVIPSYGGVTFERTITLPNGQRRTTTFLGNPPQLLEKEAIDSSPDYRCDTMEFRLDGEVTVPSQISLAVGSIVFSPPEGEECLRTRESIQSILDSKNTGIRIECVLQEFSSIRSIAEKPNSMSEEEAIRLISEAFDDAFTITGPWIFEGTVDQ